MVKVLQLYHISYVPYRIMSCNVMSCHVTYRIVSYRIISYHISLLRSLEKHDISGVEEGEGERDEYS